MHATQRPPPAAGVITLIIISCEEIYSKDVPLLQKVLAAVHQYCEYGDICVTVQVTW